MSIKIFGFSRSNTVRGVLIAAREKVARTTIEQAILKIAPHLKRSRAPQHQGILNLPF